MSYNPSVPPHSHPEVGLGLIFGDSADSSELIQYIPIPVIVATGQTQVTFQFIPGVDGLDGEDALIIPGQAGVSGNDGLDGAQPEELLALLRFAFKRIKFLEEVLDIKYGPKDILVPDEVALLEESNGICNSW